MIATAIIINATVIIIGAQPIMIDAQLIIIGAQVIMIGAQPIIIGAQLIMIGAQPIMIDAQPIMIGAQPIIICAQPITINETPNIIGAQPITINETPNIISVFTIFRQFQPALLINCFSLFAYHCRSNRYMHLVFVLLMGMLVSFLGALPLGNLNLAATQLSVQESFTNAWKFGIGVAIVEVIYLRLALTGVDWVMQHQTLFTILGWITVIIFLALGIAAFLSARKKKKDKKGILLNNSVERFLLGAAMSALNPAQLPFWFVWSTYLLNNKVLQPEFVEYNYFTVGAGLGTLAGMALYIYGGNWLITKLNTSNKTLNKVMGAIFILTAFIQLYKMIFDPFTGS